MPSIPLDMDNVLTVGKLRTMLANLPSDMPVLAPTNSGNAFDLLWDIDVSVDDVVTYYQNMMYTADGPHMPLRLVRDKGSIDKDSIVPMLVFTNP